MCSLSHIFCSRSSAGSTAAYAVSLQACNLGSGHHSFTSDLLALNSASPASCVPVTATPSILSIVTPLILSAWEAQLSSLADHCFVNYILAGIRDGFRIGYGHSSLNLVNPILHFSGRNLRSAADHPGVIQNYLHSELAAGRVTGPMVSPLPSSTRTSPFGVIPKKHQPNKWRLIVDLSSPSGSSVNDGISPSLCSVSYAGLDEAISLLHTMGPGAWMAKLDLQHAYRKVPVHPDDHPLLGMFWRNDIYLDNCLPFGLRSAPKIFSAMADALMWIMLQQGVTAGIHFIWRTSFLLVPLKQLASISFTLQ